MSRGWIVLWLAVGALGALLAGWWAADALWGDECARLVARTDRNALILGLVGICIPAGAWLASRVAPALFGSNRGQLLYLVGAATLLTVALIARDFVAQLPVIDDLNGNSVGCAL